MSSRTYYDILGVSRDATLEEITSAKNALAKVYHPDANMHKDIDTTAFMQEILEAYRVLSNPAKRKAYNLEIFGVTDRVFKTFKLTPEDEKESVPFVTYWNAAVQLQDIIDQSLRVMERASRTKTLSQKLMKKLGKNDPDEMHRERQLSRLSMQAMRQSIHIGNGVEPVGPPFHTIRFQCGKRGGLFQNRRFGALDDGDDDFGAAGADAAAAQCKIRHFDLPPCS